MDPRFRGDDSGQSHFASAFVREQINAQKTQR
jgi:hypothetical protein